MWSDVRDALAQEQLLVFQLLDLLFERTYNGGHARFNDPLDGLLDLLLDIRQCRPQRLGFDIDVGLLTLPHVLEHRACEFDDLRARLRRAQDRNKIPFDHIAADGLAVALTRLARALVVGVPLPHLAAARGPAGRQRPAAIVTHDRAAKRKVGGKIAAIDRAQSVQAILDALVCFEADQRLVVALPSRYTPIRSLDITRENRIAEHVAYALMRKLAALGFCEQGMFFKEALHVRLTAETSDSVALQGFDDDRGVRLLPNKHLAVQSAKAAIAIAPWCGEHGEAILQPRLHAVTGLFRIVHAMIVGERDRHVLHQTRG